MPTGVSGVGPPDEVRPGDYVAVDIGVVGKVDGDRVELAKLVIAVATSRVRARDPAEALGQDSGP